MSNLQAQAMRREPTEAERLLWTRLRDCRLGGFKFRRQHPLGAFVADFACLERRVIVEADGGQHVDSEYDAHRSEQLCKQGWQVIRFWNSEVRENPNGVAEAILLVLPGGGREQVRGCGATRSPSPSAQGRLDLSRVAGEVVFSPPPSSRFLFPLLLSSGQKIPNTPRRKPGVSALSGFTVTSGSSSLPCKL
jgi:very-short-patch-repair endonuclease